MRIIQRGVQIDAAEIGDLQAALDSLPPTGGGIHLPAGEYEIERTLRCHLREGQHLHLHGDGRASVLRYRACDGSPLLDFRGVENSWWPDLKVTISGLTLVGNHACGDAFHLQWPNDMLVDACFFHSFGGTAIRVTPNATNVTIRDCWMRDCRRVLHADNLHHLTFHGNQTRSVKDGLRQAENVYIGRHCREVRLVNNHFAYGHAEAVILDGTAQHVLCGNCIEGFPTGIVARDCRDIVINANYIHCDRGVLLEGDNRGLVISANVFTNTPAGALTVRDPGTSGGHVVAANVFRQSVYNDGQRGVDLGAAAGCSVTGNVFEDLTSGVPMSPAAPGPNLLTANAVDDCGQRAWRQMGCAGPRRWDAGNPFAALRAYFVAQPEAVRRLTLASWEMQRLFGGLIPAAAWEDSLWWRNDPAQPQAQAWLSAGWVAAIVNRIEGRIVFARA